MPHSLRVRLRNIERKGELEKRDVDRIIEALDYMDNVEKHNRELIKFMLLFYSEEVYEKWLEDEAYTQLVEWLNWKEENH